MSYLNISEIDVSQITFGDPKPIGEHGGKMIYLNHAKKPLVFVTPALMAPFGLNDWDNTKFSIDLSVGNQGEQGDLLKKIKDIENLVIDEAFANSSAWLKKKYASREVVAELLTSVVKYPKDKLTGEVTDKYNPTIKFHLPYKNGAFDCEAYNAQRELMDISKDSIPKGSKINVIAQLSVIWVAGGKFGCTIKIHQLKVAPPHRIAGYCFIQDEDEEVEANGDE
jgi:hypothetical protein